jgi:hypothetical protein
VTRNAVADASGGAGSETGRRGGGLSR